MKNILLIIVLLLFGCQTKKKNNDNYLKIKVIENDVKIYPKSLTYFMNKPTPFPYKYHKLAKVNIINESEDITIFLESGYLFKLLDCGGSWRRYHTISHPDSRDYSRIYLRKNDSITIYVVYDNECDTILTRFFWKRDSLELDELKFCHTTSKEEIKYHSSKKKARGSALNYSYERHKDKPILRDE